MFVKGGIANHVGVPAVHNLTYFVEIEVGTKFSVDSMKRYSGDYAVLAHSADREESVTLFIGSKQDCSVELDAMLVALQCGEPSYSFSPSELT